eukprot:1154088-Pelagomonas_calceolata.AAC.5
MLRIHAHMFLRTSKHAHSTTTGQAQFAHQPQHTCSLMLFPLMSSMCSHEQYGIVRARARAPESPSMLEARFMQDRWGASDSRRSS